MPSSWSIIALAYVFCSIVYSNAQDLQQQQQQILKNLQNGSGNGSINKQPATSVRIGLAPHERPACKLPISTGQRRVLQPVSNQQQQQQVVSSAAAGLSASSATLELGTPATSALRQSANQNRSRMQNGEQLFALPTQNTASFVLTPKSVINKPVARRTQIDSSERLRQMRQLLISNNYDGYLVGPNDEHGSEYVSDFDRRLRFISGFSGSNGYALILLDRAVLFTDGRYELQADADLDCNWWLVVGQEQFNDIISWLKSQNESNLRIGTDARLMSLAAFDFLDEQLRTKLDSEFALISQDLVDIVWDSHTSGSGNDTHHQGNRRKPDGALQVYGREFAGHLSWQEKVLRLADLMQQSPHRAAHYVVAKLDDIAWLLNLRGSDIPMAPLFKAYLFISRQAETSKPAHLSSVEQLLSAIEMQQNNKQFVSLTNQQHIFNQVIKITFYVDLAKITPAVREHLNLWSSASNTAGMNDTSRFSASSLSTRLNDERENGVSYLGQTKIQIELKDYEVFLTDFREKFSSRQTTAANVDSSSLLSLGQRQGKLLLDAQANVAIHVLAKNYENRTILVEPLIQRLKAVKSTAEVQGMRLAHWRDSLAIAMLLAQLEHDLELNCSSSSSVSWTEVSAAKELEFYRSLMDYNRGQSFDTISAYGSNGAIVHYKPNEYESEASQQFLSNDSTYLLDSGGQYLDGTTDITRTLHFGLPSDWQRETYTRVLMGAIDMMSLVFPGAEQLGPGKKLKDLLARRHLMDLGLDYAHGTGHGIGSYSLVHEAPPLIEHYATGSSLSKISSSSTPANSPRLGAQVHSDSLALQPNMFSSVEPGYYEVGQFGIRLENIVVTQSFERPPIMNNYSAHKSSSFEKSLLRFEPISLVPFEPKLIKFDLMSNKQKAWLNSYNLMVRLRMTQQINYYLARLRQQQAMPSDASSLMNNSTSNNFQRSNWSGNLLKIDPSKFQLLLEQAHKWILRKTELIPLDVPQRLITNQLGLAESSMSGKTDQRPSESDNNHSNNNNNKDLWSSLGTDADGQRLMLAYMAQLPFGDSDAAQAAASLLSGRADHSPASPSAQSSDKCSGIECDLLLLEALNAHQAAHKAKEDQSINGGNNNWNKSNNEGGASSLAAASDEQSYPSSAWQKWSQQLMDLFHLSGYTSTSGGASNGSPSSQADNNNNNNNLNDKTMANFILANIWPLICFGALLVLVLQFALMLYVCSGGGGGEDDNNSSASGRRQSMSSATRRGDRSTSGWQSTASGRRLTQLGDTFGSFRLGRSTVPTTATTTLANTSTELTAVV